MFYIFHHTLYYIIIIIIVTSIAIRATKELLFLYNIIYVIYTTHFKIIRQGKQMASRVLLNLSYKPVSSGNGYYNLSTSRWKKATDQLNFSHEEITVTGTTEEISQFKEINSIDLECKTNYSKTIKRLKKIDEDQLDTFDLKNLRCPGRVTRILDADTFIIIAEIPCCFFNNKYQKKETDGSEGIHYGKSKGRITVKLTVRVHSIDTGEKKTAEGKEIKRFSEKVISDAENILYFHFLGLGARSRYLAEVFIDSKYTQRYDDLMINYKNDPKYCYRYYGKTKKK